MRHLHLACHSGVSGDMLLGALVDVGVPLEALNDEIAKLGISGLSLTARQVSKSGISAQKIDVNIESNLKLKHYRDARAITNDSGLSGSIKERSLAALRAIAVAEAKIHNTDIESVHFHELGSLDTIADIVGVFAGLEYLQVTSVSCSPIAVGGGVVAIDHGVVPNPAPATLELLQGLVIDRSDLVGERATPTGAAILRVLLTEAGLQNSAERKRNQQEGVLRGIGYGAGSADFQDRVNVLRAELYESVVGAGESLQRDQIIQLESTIDDMNPQLYGYLFERLYAAGALEVLTIAIMTKKSRPGHNLMVLAPQDKLDALAEIILTESTSSGVRYRRVERIKAERTLLEVEICYGTVTVKRIGFKQTTRWQPEYDSCLALARSTGAPLIEIMRLAQQAAQEQAKQGS
ncbi:nickel pincer cofactor biosynthesis protein LarC [Gemmatimonas aurantiaca]|nr:nickel pincer cofactor biosynthesis protein LarC [Gemmatimonas aurantiaca]